METDGVKPMGTCLGMDISIGALPYVPVKTKVTKVVEGYSAGPTKFFHGIHPQWKFIDEKYFDKWLEEQIVHKERLHNMRKSRITLEQQQHTRVQEYLNYFVGPPWYQELSPKQKEMIDNLKDAIKKDLDSQLTNTTRTCMSLLGLKPLPNDSQLWKSLTKSYGCPVEFLLILSRLIKRKKDTYSINDRLLLSGVAHLTLRDTLKEIHIRSPSPPRKEKKPPPPKPKPKRKKYCSTYLVPFALKLKQRKSSDYKNPYIQKPESPYFSYIEEMEKEKLVSILQPIERDDNDLKIPCDLFQEHLEAEKYYNKRYRRTDNFRYILPRPHIYETCSPKIHPSPLPIHMTEKTYPPPIKLSFEMKIYNEIDTRTHKTRKVSRVICEASMIPAGRITSGTKGKLITKYLFIKDIGEYLEKNAIRTQQENLNVEGPNACLICGGEEGKLILPEKKPIKPKCWIKKPKKIKKIKERLDINSSDYMLNFTPKNKEIKLDEKTLKIREENRIYVETYEKLFKNIEQMEELRLATQQCVCPDKTKSPKKMDPSIDCTCAIWNLPPEKIEKEFSCECRPQKKDSYELAPTEAKCDCRQKVKEKKMEACGQCGRLNAKTSEGSGQEKRCACIDLFDACGNCVKQTPIKFPLLDNEKRKECDCCDKLSVQQKEVTVGYAFIGNNQVGRAEAKSSTKSREKKQNKTPVDVDSDDVECLRTCSKLLQLDNCKREAVNLLNMLKCDCVTCKDSRRKYRAKFITSGTKHDCCGKVSVITGTFDNEETECNCLEKYERRIQGISDYKKRMKAKLDLKSQKNQYIIGGVQQTPDGPIFNLLGVIPKKKEKNCVCLGTSEDHMIEDEKRENLISSLKREYQYTITGCKEGHEGREYVLEAVKEKSDCTELYKDFMDEHNECLVEYEKYLQRMNREISAYMDEMRDRYKNPPLTGKKLVEEELKRMIGPGMPEGKSEFVVSGVVANALGQSFLLGGVLLDQKEKEECTIAVESYTHLPEENGTSKDHRTYLCNYMTFGRECSPFRPPREIEVSNSSEELICRCISYESIPSKSTVHYEDFEEEEVRRCACECSCSDIERPSECTCAMESEEDYCVCAEQEEDVDEEEEHEIDAPYGCSCGLAEVKSSGPASDPCLCNYKNCGCQVGEVCVKECFYGPMEAWWSKHDLSSEQTQDEEKESSELSIMTIGGPLRKYVILQEMPKRWKRQEEALKKLLSGLAEDGYPLAKLPACHMLPQFRLWLQFRRRERWNYRDGMKELWRMFSFWRSIDACWKRIPLPKLPIYCPCESRNFTWTEAEKLKKMIRETKQKYYDKVREQIVRHGRTFYASISPYKFPNPPYLNHYFYAYQPGKTENCVAEFVWNKHEHKNPRDRQSCFCI